MRFLACQIIRIKSTISEHSISVLNNQKQRIEKMDQTLDCILLARRKENERKKIEQCLSSETGCETIVDRHRLTFEPQSQIVTIKKASNDVLFSVKILGCRMPYKLLKRLLDGDYSKMDGFEWL